MRDAGQKDSKKRLTTFFKPSFGVESLEDRTLLSGTPITTEPWNDVTLPRQEKLGFQEPSSVIVSGLNKLITINVNQPSSFDSPIRVPLGFGPFEDTEVDIISSLTVPNPVAYFSFFLNPGDILGAAVDLQAGSLDLYDSRGNLLIGTDFDVSNGYPSQSPLPRGGNANISHVAREAGQYILAVSNVVDTDLPNFDLRLRLFRPALETQEVGARQILFLDFDGATVDRGIFQIPGTSGPAVLSPLRDFLPRWGLSPSNENAVIDAIVDTVQRTLSRDIRLRGGNGDFAATGIDGQFDIQILNSRDHADPWGKANVSRIIIGGTIDELGIDGILGIAQSIDPGNFATEETAVVLLDLLSDFPVNPNSLNGIPISPLRDKVGLIGVAVGNIVAHEAGHFFGNYHTDPFNDVNQIMDQGGNIGNRSGLGPDGIFGTADDVTVLFGSDFYTPTEFFRGIQDSVNNLSWGLSTGTGNAGSGNIASLFAIDVSSSMFGINRVDVNGDGRLNGEDDINKDGIDSTLLDLALAPLVQAFNEGRLPNLISIVAFGQTAQTLDMSAAPGFQAVGDPYADTDQNGRADFLDIIESLRENFAGYFNRTGLGQGVTLYDDVLSTIRSTIVANPQYNFNNRVTVISDGAGLMRTNSQALADLAALTRVDVVALGPYAQSAPVDDLKTIAFASGGLVRFIEGNIIVDWDGGYATQIPLGVQVAINDEFFYDYTLVPSNQDRPTIPSPSTQATSSETDPTGGNTSRPNSSTNSNNPSGSETNVSPAPANEVASESEANDAHGTGDGNQTPEGLVAEAVDEIALELEGFFA